MSLSSDRHVVGAPRPDILPGFTRRTISLRPDDEGEVVATLVEHAPQSSHRKAVLYLHGYIDYFFRPRWRSSMWITASICMSLIYGDTGVL